MSGTRAYVLMWAPTPTYPTYRKLSYKTKLSDFFKVREVCIEELSSFDNDSQVNLLQMPISTFKYREKIICASHRYCYIRVVG